MRRDPRRWQGSGAQTFGGVRLLGEGWRNSRTRTRTRLLVRAGTAGPCCLIRPAAVTEISRPRTAQGRDPGPDTLTAICFGVFIEKHELHCTVYFIIVVCSNKSMCIPSFIFIGCCVSELKSHLYPYCNVCLEAVY